MGKNLTFDSRNTSEIDRYHGRRKFKLRRLTRVRVAELIYVYTTYEKQSLIL